MGQCVKPYYGAVWGNLTVVFLKQCNSKLHYKFLSLKLQINVVLTPLQRSFFFFFFDGDYYRMPLVKIQRLTDHPSWYIYNTILTHKARENLAGNFKIIQELNFLIFCRIFILFSMIAVPILFLSIGCRGEAR